MSVRVRFKCEAAVSSTSAEERDLGNKKYEVVSDGLGEGGTWKTLLVAGAVDVEVTLRNVAAARMLMVATNVRDQNQSPSVVNLKRQSNLGEVIAIEPMSGTRTGHMLLTTSGLTAVYLSNPGTVDMEVTLVVAGD